MSCSCASNTIVVTRPTSGYDQNAVCQPCTIGLTDPVGCGKIGPRRSREKVREQCKDYALLMLGAPVVRIELNQQQLDAAVDLALQVFEDYAPAEYYSYYVFQTTPGQSIYTMPPDVGIIRNVYYKTTGTFGFQGNDLGGALPIEYFYPGGAYASIQGGLLDPTQPLWGRAGEWTLYKEYEFMYSRISSQIGGWEWIGGPCNIKLYPVPCRSCYCSVHYLQKRPDFQQVTQAMFEGSLAFAKIMLGQIRSKYSQLPGPQGGAQLDGQAMLQQGIQEKKEWEERLITRYSDLLPILVG